MTCARASSHVINDARADDGTSCHPWRRAGGGQPGSRATAPPALVPRQGHHLLHRRRLLRSGDRRHLFISESHVVIGCRTESVVGALGMVARSGLQSGLSLGAALGFYSRWCSLEQFRSKPGPRQPFLVGGIMGAFGAVQRVEVHDGQRKMRVLAYSPRGMAVGALTSGMLCSLFWYIQQPTRREAASPSAGEGVSPPSPQRQTQRPPAPLSTPSLPPAPRGEDWRSRAEVADPYAASQGASSAELLLTDGQTLDGSGGGATTTVAGAGEMMQLQHHSSWEAAAGIASSATRTADAGRGSRCEWNGRPAFADAATSGWRARCGAPGVQGPVGGT